MINILLALNLMFCDIKGEVENPGVYEIKNNNIQDVINLAGGLTSNANVSNINLSKNVYDEMVIYIPSKKDKITQCPKCICPITTCENVIPKPEIIITTTIPPIITSPKKEIININKDTLEDLISLDGIGEIIAQKVIEYRILTPFIYKEDIMNIQGIGPSLFAKVKDFITV